MPVPSCRHRQGRRVGRFTPKQLNEGDVEPEAMCGDCSHLVSDEVGDVDACAHSGVDLIPRRERSGPEKLGGRAASVDGEGFGRRKRQGGDVIHGTMVRGDSLVHDTR